MPWIPLNINKIVTFKNDFLQSRKSFDLYSIFYLRKVQYMILRIALSCSLKALQASKCISASFMSFAFIVALNL